MATNPTTIDYIVQQLSGAGRATWRKMFGEYMIYVDERPIFGVCNDTVYVKCLPQALALIPDALRQAPYPGAREHLVVDIDDSQMLCQLARAMVAVVPVPVRRTRKK